VVLVAWGRVSRLFPSTPLSHYPDKQSACKKSKLDSGECGCYSQIMVRINAAYDTLKSKCDGVDDGTASNSSSWFSWW